MNKNKTRKWLLIGILATPVVIVFSYVIFWTIFFLVYLPIKSENCRKGILKANPSELLQSCRLIIGQYALYTNEWTNMSILGLDGKGIELEGKENDPAYQRLPNEIQRLRPRNLIIGTNHVFISFVDSPRSSLRAYSEGASRLDRPFSDRWYLLTNGLWFCN